MHAANAARREVARDSMKINGSLSSHARTPYPVPAVEPIAERQSHATATARRDPPEDPSGDGIPAPDVAHYNAPLVKFATPVQNVVSERSALFEGVFLGGFECSCHQLEDGRRLDLLNSSGHAQIPAADFARLRGAGMTACRDGVSWVRAEIEPGRFDFSFLLPVVKAADQHQIQVIWDLMHFGWPAHVDVFDMAFPQRFARYASAFAHWLKAETRAPTMITPINEMSYLAWAGGDVRCMNPFEAARGVELKVQLVRATIQAIDAIRRVFPTARFLQPEPLINIVPEPAHPKTWRRVESDNLLQYQVWDMLCGRIWPSLGGHPRYLDIVGVNFYADNQFMLDGTTIWLGDERYRPFSRMLLDAWQRYRRPMILSETGHEGSARAPWLRYVCSECITAMAAGCQLHGITIYPVVNTLGWGDDRRCENGLWDDADEAGERAICRELADEIDRQTPRLRAARTRALVNADAGAPWAQTEDS